MKAEVKTITPELAKEYLRHNDSNRALRRTRVLQYAHDMKEGKWNLTGQGITFGKDGNLLDGQHRLHAVVFSGVSVDFLVVTDADTVATYDCGLTRSMVDRFKLAGNGNGPIYTAAGQAVIRLCYIIKQHGTVSANISPTTSDIEEYINENVSDMVWATSLMEARHNNLKGLRRSVIAATLYSIYKLNVGLTKEDVEYICDVLKSGVQTYEYDVSIIAVRNKILLTGGAGNGVNVDLFLRLQFMCKQYINRSTTLRTVCPKENIYDFTMLNTDRSI